MVRCLRRCMLERRREDGRRNRRGARGHLCIRKAQVAMALAERSPLVGLLLIRNSECVDTVRQRVQRDALLREKQRSDQNIDEPLAEDPQHDARVYAPESVTIRSRRKVRASTGTYAAATKLLPRKQGEGVAQPGRLIVIGVPVRPSATTRRRTRPLESPSALVAARGGHQRERRLAACNEPAGARRERIGHVVVRAADKVSELMRGGMHRQRAAQIGDGDRMKAQRIARTARAARCESGPAAAFDTGAAHRPIHQDERAVHVCARAPAFQRQRLSIHIDAPVTKVCQPCAGMRTVWPRLVAIELADRTHTRARRDVRAGERAIQFCNQESRDRGRVAKVLVHCALHARGASDDDGN
jgi:hypothetical protein